jgi:hypothetical protein
MPGDESITRSEPRAAAAELRFVEGFLGMVRRSGEESALAAADDSLARFAGKLARRVGGPGRLDRGEARMRSDERVARWDLLVPAISPDLRRLIGYRLHRLRIEGEVEDLLQDTFLRVLKAEAGGRIAPRDLGAYLRRVADRVTIDHARERRAQKRRGGALVVAGARAQCVAGLPAASGLGRSGGFWREPGSRENSISRSSTDGTTIEAGRPVPSSAPPNAPSNPLPGTRRL